MPLQSAADCFQLWCAANKVENYYNCAIVHVEWSHVQVFPPPYSLPITAQLLSSFSPLISFTYKYFCHSFRTFWFWDTFRNSWRWRWLKRSGCPHFGILAASRCRVSNYFGKLFRHVYLLCKLQLSFSFLSSSICALKFCFLSFLLFLIFRFVFVSFVRSLLMGLNRVVLWRFACGICEILSSARRAFNVISTKIWVYLALARTGRNIQISNRQSPHLHTHTQI